MPLRERLGKIALLLLVSAVLTEILQTAVGDPVLYAPSPEGRLMLHQAILHNQPPFGFTWEKMGAAGTNVRVFVVYLAEGIHRLSGAAIPAVYRGLDSVCLFLSFPLLFWYLRSWLGESLCLVGVLYVASVAALTYHHHYFHPWDRLSFLCWIGLLWLLRSGRLVSFGLLLVVTTTVKFDVVFLPLLYGVQVAVTRGKLTRALTVTAGLLAMTWGTFFLLNYLLPGGKFTEGALAHPWSFLQKNASSLKTLNVAYPPLLLFLLPVLLSCGQVMRKRGLPGLSALFGLLMTVPYLTSSNFREVRAEMPLLLLFLPAALLRLQDLLRATAVEGESPSSEVHLHGLGETVVPSSGRAA